MPSQIISFPAVAQLGLLERREGGLPSGAFAPSPSKVPSLKYEGFSLHPSVSMQNKAATEVCKKDWGLISPESTNHFSWISAPHDWIPEH